MVLSSYIVKNKNIDVRINSQSGGIFAALSDYVLLQSGVIYGCLADEHLYICHKGVTTSDGRNRLRGSKYVQSDMKNCFEEVKNDLIDGKTVLFSGTPCQVVGLKSYCSSVDISNLLCIDIICHGVPTQLIYMEYLEYLSKKYNGNVEEFIFRNKKQFGWQSHVETFKVNGVDYNEILFKELFYRGNILRPACYECPYKNLDYPTDITIGDAWGIDTVDADFNDKKGASLVLIKTEKGNEIFEAVKDACILRKISMKHYMQTPLIKPSKLPKSREQFWMDYKEENFSVIIQKYAKIKAFRMLKRKIRKIILVLRNHG